MKHSRALLRAGTLREVRRYPPSWVEATILLGQVVYGSATPASASQWSLCLTESRASVPGSRGYTGPVVRLFRAVPDGPGDPFSLCRRTCGKAVGGEGRTGVRRLTPLIGQGSKEPTGRRRGRSHLGSFFGQEPSRPPSASRLTKTRLCIGPTTKEVNLSTIDRQMTPFALPPGGKKSYEDRLFCREGMTPAIIIKVMTSWNYVQWHHHSKNILEGGGKTSQLC